ncbi:hypothetical protein D9753_32450 [Streptomyces dangxiongensis]|uniref:Isochorismatase family protein n=2 Tax=Streptomyces dangxiongensis TaxID=1442032 RepID=A0A3G2JK40_9ACTN|nr:hypothetical protein D9753_32450 [Streptomyces dangxiongensis]
MLLAGDSPGCRVLSTALAALAVAAEVLVVADARTGVDDDLPVRTLRTMELYRPLIRVTSLAGLRAEAGP